MNAQEHIAEIIKNIRETNYKYSTKKIIRHRSKNRLEVVKMRNLRPLAGYSLYAHDYTQRPVYK
jgi:hypothetical protein